MRNGVDSETMIEGQSSSILDPYRADSEFVLEIRNHDEDWPDEMEDIVIEKRRHTHPTSPIPRRNGGAPFRPGR